LALCDSASATCDGVTIAIDRNRPACREDAMPLTDNGIRRQRYSDSHADHVDDVIRLLNEVIHIRRDDRLRIQVWREVLNGHGNAYLRELCACLSILS
jgi:hypothetical protein